MTQNPSLPNPEKVEQTVNKMRDVCHQFDNLNLALDELIAQIELDIRNSPLTAYREGKNIRHPINSESAIALLGCFQRACNVLY